MKKICGKLLAAPPETSPDILYASGFLAPDEIVYAQIGRRKMIFVSILELDRACSQAKKGVEVLDRDAFFKKDDSRNESTLLLNISRKFGVNSWSVPSAFPVSYADTLRKNGIEVIPENGEFFPGRARKTADEVRKIADAMSATQDAMMLVRDFLRESRVNSKGFVSHGGKVVTSEQLRGMIEGFLKTKEYTASQTITAAGSQGSQPHNVGTGPIKAGEPIVVDIFPRSDRTGFWGDMTRTFVKGKPLPVVERAFKAVLEASRLAESMIRSGITGKEVHEAAAESMRKAGFLTGHNKQGVPCGFIHGLGHGVGLWIHEAPTLSLRNSGPLEIGNVVSNEPGLYNPSWGGIRLEDCVLVQKNGCKNFYTMEKELIL